MKTIKTIMLVIMSVIVLVVGLVVFLPLVTSMLAGTCDTIEFPNVNDVNISVTNNSSNMEGFNWSKNGTTIEYCFAVNYKPDNFTIKWYNEEEVYISEQQGGGGSRWSSKKVVVNETEEEVIEDKEQVEDKSYLEEWEDAIKEKSPILTIIIVILLSILALILLKNVSKHYKKNKEDKGEED